MLSNPSQPKILVVDDDPAIRHLVSRFLSFNHYQVEVAGDARTARMVFERFKPDLAILDVNLPDDSGFNLCREMQTPQTMILMLTCLSDTNYVLEGFERGADEYLTKPFNLEILKAKIGALLKRQSPLEIPPPTPQKGLTFGNLTIDSDRCEVSVGGKLISLTRLEFELLYFLATHPEKVWGRGELMSAVWGTTGDAKAERKVDVHIGQIRKKIGDSEGDCIKTVRSKGYVFAPPGYLSEPKGLSH